MRKNAYAAAFAAFLLSGCGGAGSPAPRQPAQDTTQGKQESAAWQYETEVDKMTDRTVHYLIAEGKGDAGESYGLALKCDGAPQFLLDSDEATSDIEWETLDGSGRPTRRVSIRMGSRLVPGLLTDTQEEIRLAPLGADVQYVSMNVLLGAAETAKQLGADRIDKRQVAEIAEHAVAGLAEVLASDKLLLSGVHPNEVIEFPAPKGDPNAARFFSACKASVYGTFGLEPPQTESPAGRTVTEADIEPGPAPVVDDVAEPAASSAAPAMKTTVHVEAGSLEPSESGDGFSFESKAGKQYYVTANADISRPGADLVMSAATDQTPICLVEFDGEVVKIEPGACD